MYVNAESEKSLILSLTFGSECSLLGDPHLQRAMYGILWRYERVDIIHQLVFCGHGEREVSVPESSEFGYHRFRISIYEPINIDKILSCQLFVNLG